MDHATITDINATDKDSNTSLHKACSRYNINKEKINVIRYLLKQPSIISNKKNYYNETPLEICKREIDNYSNPNYRHNKHYCIEMIQLLEDYHNQQHWQVFCFLMNYDLCKSFKQSNTKLRHKNIERRIRNMKRKENTQN